jgi:hypothetical protein
MLCLKQGTPLKGIHPIILITSGSQKILPLLCWKFLKELKNLVSSKEISFGHPIGSIPISHPALDKPLVYSRFIKAYPLCSANGPTQTTF